MADEESKLGGGVVSAPFVAKKKLVPRLTISENPSEVFVVQFSPDGRLLAAGCNDGVVRVYQASSGRLAYQLGVASSGDPLPITALRFRPASTSSKTKNVLLAVSANGTAKHWHITSGRCMHTIEEEDNQLYCVDYKADGSAFATAGKDRAIRLYDEATKAIISDMSGGLAHVTPGHSNRVFSLKFDPDAQDLIVTGGWDNTVQIWDCRVGHAVRSFFGPHIAGDGVDVVDGVVLTGSWRPEDPLETWDLGTGKKIESIPFDSGEPCLLYSAKFSKDPGGTLVAAGGSGANEARVFDRKAGNQLVGTVTGLTRGVFTLDFHQHRLLACAGGDAAVRIYEVREGVESALETPVGAGTGAGAGAGASDDIPEGKGEESL